MLNTVKNRIVEIWKENRGTRAIVLTIACIVGALIGYFGVMCLMAWLVMLLWNWIAVDLYDVPALTFWTAFGLLWLCSLLFKCGITTNKKS